jgi:energy-coupling factor transporter transmembrane protein EcfT
MAVLLFMGHISFHHIFHALRPTLPFIMILFIFQILFPEETSHSIMSFGPIHITAGGIASASIVTWRFIVLLISGALLTITTAPSNLTQGIERLIHPIAIIGISSTDIAVMVTLALRFIPTITFEIDTLKAAHAARGAALSDGGINRRLKVMVTLVVPLCFAIFRRSDELIIAMEARGYDGGKRTGLTVLTMAMRDWVIIGISVGAVIVSLAN